MPKENKNQSGLAKYLKYAIGEISLVVIGILLALGIGKYSDQIKTDKRTQVYLKELKNEFENNLKTLEFTISKNRENIDYATRISEIIGKNESFENENEMAIFIGNSLGYSPIFKSENSILTELISSGALKDMPNLELRKRLASWTRNMDDLKFQEELLHKNQAEAFNMVRQKGSLRSIFNSIGVTENLLEIDKTEPKTGNLNLLNDNQFDNNILLFITTSKVLEASKYQPMKKEIEIILELIKNEIN